MAEPIIVQHLRAKIDELQIALANVKEEQELERELLKGAESDLKAAQHDLEHQKNEIQELEKRLRGLKIAGLEMAATIEAEKAKKEFYRARALEKVGGDRDN